MALRGNWLSQANLKMDVEELCVIYIYYEIVHKVHHAHDVNSTLQTFAIVSFL